MGEGVGRKNDNDFRAIPFGNICLRFFLFYTYIQFKILDILTFFILFDHALDLQLFLPREHEGTERDTEGVGCDMS